MSKHDDYMQLAYGLALKGWGKTSPNPMVGALLVKKGRVIAEGWHAACGASHAEAMAIRKAGDEAKGATLYVTLEPCSHFGRTPPCTEAIIKAGIKKVYVGVLDPNPKMNGKSIDLLRKAGISVEAGFLEKPLNRLNESFNKYITTGMPFVTAKIAQTLDGKIATLSGESKWITSEEARAFSRQLRTGFDAIMVGSKTVLKDNPQLNASDASKRLKKVVLDSQLSIPLKAKLFQGMSVEDVIIITTSKAPAAKVKSFGRKAQVWVAPTRGKAIDLLWVFKELAKREIACILIEGGGTLIGNALGEKLVDKMHIYLAPKIMGEGLASVRGFNAAKIKDVIELNDTVISHIGDELFIEGYV